MKFYRIGTSAGTQLVGYRIFRVTSVSTPTRAPCLSMTTVDDGNFVFFFAIQQMHKHEIVADYPGYGHPVVAHVVCICDFSLSFAAMPKRLSHIKTSASESTVHDSCRARTGA